MTRISNKIPKRTACMMVLILIIASVVLMKPHPAQAQLGGLLGCQSMGTGFGKEVPVQSNSIDAMKNVECIWNGLAWSVAKIALQQITGSVVNWINSGFEGNPSFITDPGSFFADTADQITGVFISQSGVLSRLCSPFSIDIRLALAFQGKGYTRERYACTLSTIINNAANSRVNVSGNVSVNGRTVAAGGVSANGASIDGFLNGDFSQGGWPAFVAMTTQPQNNIYGAYLQAKSDLEQQIANRQNNIRLDLQLGRGFLSYTKCDDIDIENQNLQYSVDASGEIQTGQDYRSGADYSLRKTLDSNGNIKYQNCKTETPGSVIAGSLDKSLGIPQDQLNIADSINEIVGALFSQLVTRVLSGGLYSASDRGNSNYTAGVVNQLLEEKEVEKIRPVQQQLAFSAGEYETGARQYVTIRQQNLETVAATKIAYETAAACFRTKIASVSSSAISTAQRAQAENQISAINASMAIVDTVIGQYQTKLDDATLRLRYVQTLITEINAAKNVAELTLAGNRFDAAVQGGSADGTIPAFVSANDIAVARTDSENATDQASRFTKEAETYQKSCDSFSPTSPWNF